MEPEFPALFSFYARLGDFAGAVWAKKSGIRPIIHENFIFFCYNSRDR